MAFQSFHESQRFRALWIWAILALLAAGAGFIFVRQVLLHHPVGSNPIPDSVAWVLLPAFGLGLPLLFALTRLDVGVDADGVDIRYGPFSRRRIPLEALESAEATTFDPLGDYGGWGIRKGAGGWAYTMDGKQGVQLRLKDGSQVLVGSRRSGDLAQAIQEAAGI